MSFAVGDEVKLVSSINFDTCDGKHPPLARVVHVGHAGQIVDIGVFEEQPCYWLRFDGLKNVYGVRSSSIRK